MAHISQDTWDEILENQKYPLIGTNEPNNGNGFNDAISWRKSFHTKSRGNDRIHAHQFNSIYLRDLSYDVNPSLSRKNKLKDGLKIVECSDNYYKTFLRYFVADRYRYKTGDFLEELGRWGDDLCYDGRVVFEIVGWYGNNSSQFYAFELFKLENSFCKVGRKTIIYNAPYSMDGEKEVFKKVKIPRDKCIVIDFPKELGGYKGFLKKRKEIYGLGNKIKLNSNPGKELSRMKEWDKKFNKIVSEWGNLKQDNVTEFYQGVSILRFKYMAISCTHEVINGLKQLIDYLNLKLYETARVDFEVEEYKKSYLLDIQKKWKSGDISFQKFNEIIRI